MRSTPVQRLNPSILLQLPKSWVKIHTSVGSGAWCCFLEEVTADEGIPTSAESAPTSAGQAPSEAANEIGSGDVTPARLTLRLLRSLLRLQGWAVGCPSNAAKPGGIEPSSVV